MKPYILFLVCLIICSNFIYAQREASNWYFGANAGITFKNGAPVALTDGIINQREGVATISDANGNLLFYTDGYQVWNRNHTLMPNGSGLYGDPQSAQAAVIVPMPNNPAIYYIFTVSNWPYTGVDRGLFYSTVDVTLNGGLGEVVNKNTVLNLSPREQVSAAFHDNCRDIWIMSHEKGNDKFVAYLLSPTGVDPMPVVSSIGQNYTGGNRYGYLRFSPDGKKLCNTLGYATGGAPSVPTTQLFDFDKATGVVSNLLTLTYATALPDYRDAYSSEFSSDNSKLYMCSFSGSYIYQWDLSSGNPAAIMSSMVNVGTTADKKVCLQMGPDKKIYVSKEGMNWLGCINDPNQPGAACNYNNNAVQLSGRGQLGLPNFLPGFFSMPYLGVDTSVCPASSVLLNAYTQPGETYLWQDGSTNPTFSATAAGTYWVEVTKGSCIKRDEIDIVAQPNPVLNLGPDIDICPGGFVTLYATLPNATYLWPDGSTGVSWDVSTAGTHTVTVKVKGCIGTDAVDVRLLPAPSVELGNDTAICESAPLKLDAYTGPGLTYQWYDVVRGVTFSLDSAVHVSQAGVYIVDVWDANMCMTSDVIDITTLPAPVFDLGNDTTICSSASLVLNASAAGAVSYEWKDLSTAPTFNVSGAGDYWVKASDGTCSTFDTIAVAVVAAPGLNLGNDTTICAGTTLTIDAYNAPGNNYQWQDGGTASSIAVAAAGKYWVDVSNAGCMVTDTIEVTTRPAPMFRLGNDTTLCTSATLVLDASAAGAVSYEWKDLSTASTFTVNAAGDYWVKATDGSCSAFDTIKVSMVAPPMVALGNDTTVCVGDPLVLNAASMGATGYVWKDGAITPGVTVSLPGEYWVEVTNGMCSARDTILVRNKPWPAVVLGADTLLCNAGAVLLTAGPVRVHTFYQWQDGSLNNTYNVTRPGTYWVKVSEDGCVSADTINVAAIPVLQLGNSDTTACLGQNLVLTAPVIPAATYRWQDGSTLPQFVVSQPGFYEVEMTTVCGVQSDVMVVKYEDCNCRITIPNAFSPDHNFRNDVFKPVIRHCSFTEYKLTIYNRWGQRVFETSNPVMGWDGSYNGHAADMGAYVYVFSYKAGSETDKVVKKGMVMLVR